MTLHQKLRRTLTRAALLVTAAALGFTASATAEVKVSTALPDAMMRAFREGPVSADQLRKYGLTVRVEGEEEIRLVVIVHAVKKGQVSKPWMSRPLPTISGGGTVKALKWLPPNEYLPAEKFGQGGQFQPKEQFRSGDTFLSVESVRGFLRDVNMPGDWSGFFIVVSPTDSKTAHGTETNPLFFNSDPVPY